MSPYTLTHIVYVVILVLFLGAVTYGVLYSRKQKAEQQKAERGGARPHSTQEAIVMSQEQAKKDAARK